jgi:uncharacterized protein
MWADFVLFVAVGFAAQLVDGAIGMAYGVTAMTALLAMGTPPAVGSASVHAAEVFTTAASGFFHWRLGNIRWRLIRDLALPGVIGGACGAYVLAKTSSSAIRPVVTTYLFILGGVIVVKALRKVVPPFTESTTATRVLGLVGGFVDAIGGGGWGPLVTSTLISRGAKPRFAIGSANLAEFFVTATIAGTFVMTIGLELWPIIAGLIVGGAAAAPLAAYATRRLPDRPMMILVGSIVMLLSLRGLLEIFSP